MNPSFPADYQSILQRIDDIDPIAYGKNRNYINGAVTCLSPYISRGVISTKQVLQRVLQNGYSISQILPFVKELCWRDYFQRVAQVKDLCLAVKQEQRLVAHYEIPETVLSATTGITGIDAAIKELYETGYMHNHCRMYTASLVCNMAQAHWLQPAQWMYYHLLDGDWASNACSWQWVAGANSHKKYYANQENINKYTYTSQSATFLDHSYEALEQLEIPAELILTQKFTPVTELPSSSTISIDASLPTFVYTYYNLDPLWHENEPGNRILLLEPAFFSRYPVSKKCIDFIMALSKNIPDIQVYTGSFDSFINAYQPGTIYYKEHPFNADYHGIEEPRDWIAPAITGYYPSFFTYWKKAEKKII